MLYSPLGRARLSRVPVFVEEKRKKFIGIQSVHHRRCEDVTVTAACLRRESGPRSDSPSTQTSWRFCRRTRTGRGGTDSEGNHTRRDLHTLQREHPDIIWVSLTERFFYTTAISGYEL